MLLRHSGVELSRRKVELEVRNSCFSILTAARPASTRTIGPNENSSAL
jgi:hypothetical protein